MTVARTAKTEKAASCAATNPALGGRTVRSVSWLDKRATRRILDGADDYEPLPESTFFGKPSPRMSEPTEDSRCEVCGQRSYARLCDLCGDELEKWARDRDPLAGWEKELEPDD